MLLRSQILSGISPENLFPDGFKRFRLLNSAISDGISLVFSKGKGSHHHPTNKNPSILIGARNGYYSITLTYFFENFMPKFRFIRSVFGR